MEIIHLASSLDTWEDIVKDVAKEHVPLEVIKEVEIKTIYNDGQSINIQMLRDEGVSVDDLELIVTTAMVEAKDDLQGIEFVVDVELVKEQVQPLTSNLLRKLDMPYLDDDDDDDQ